MYDTAMDEDDYGPEEENAVHILSSINQMVRTTSNSFQTMRNSIECTIEAIDGEHFKIAEAIEELRGQAAHLRSEMYQYDDWGFGGIHEHAKLLAAERLVAAYDAYCATIEDEIDDLSEEKMLEKWDGERWW